MTYLRMIGFPTHLQINKIILMKRIIGLALCFCLITTVYAQDEETERVKKVDHYIGVQANYLLREILNLGGNNTILQNPYGFVYHLNAKKSGYGFRLGIGPRIYSSTNRDGSAIITTNGYNFTGRVGFDKRIPLNNKWETGIGLDLLFNIENDKTVTDQANFQRFKSEIQTNNSHFGGGPMGYIRYFLRKNVLLGTEVSFYYLTGENKSKIKFTDEFGNVTTQTDDTDKFNNGQLNLPISLYLFIML